MTPIYKFINLDNGDILLEKVILDHTKYKIIDNNNGNKLLKKIESINITNINDIKNYDFKKSVIVSCFINNDKIIKLKYKSILNSIYRIINNGTQIIKTSKLNIKTINKFDEGFYYLDDLGISVQGVDSNKCLLEIIEQSSENKINLVMKIKLNDGKDININF